MPYVNDECVIWSKAPELNLVSLREEIWLLTMEFLALCTGVPFTTEIN